jgi:hypothetical protein
MTSPTPNTPQNFNQMIPLNNVNLVKTATPDIVLFDDESLSIDLMSDLIFENIGGQELINISRSDTINGQDISYQLIKNAKSLQQLYNSNNIIGLQKTLDKYFLGFSILLDNKIPENGSGLNGNNLYIDEFGNLIIEFINLNSDEQIEVELSTSGTIYTVQFNGGES